MIKNVSHVLEARGINIDAMHARARQGHGEVVFALTINTLDELEGLLHELRRVKGVLSGRALKRQTQRLGARFPSLSKGAPLCRRKPSSTPRWPPRPSAPYSQAVAYGDLLFVSGQIPIDPANGQIVPGGVVEQATRAMDNLNAILNEAGLGFENILKTTIYLNDMGDFKAANEVYGRYFKGDYPARATVQAAKLPLGVLFEVDAVAGR